MKKNCCWVIYKRVIIQNQANEHNTDKQNLDKKNGDVENRIPHTSGWEITTDVHTKVGEFEGKIAHTSGLLKKLEKSRRKYLMLVV